MYKGFGQRALRVGGIDGTERGRFGIVVERKSFKREKYKDLPLDAGYSKARGKKQRGGAKRDRGSDVTSEGSSQPDLGGDRSDDRNALEGQTESQRFSQSKVKIKITRT